MRDKSQRANGEELEKKERKKKPKKKYILHHESSISYWVWDEMSFTLLLFVLDVSMCVDDVACAHYLSPGRAHICERFRSNRFSPSEI